MFVFSLTLQTLVRVNRNTSLHQTHFKSNIILLLNPQCHHSMCKVPEKTYTTFGRFFLPKRHEPKVDEGQGL